MHRSREPGPPRRTRGRPGAEDRASSRAALGSYLTHGFTFAAVLLVFTGMGYWLDGRLHTLPLLTVLGAAVGGVSGFLHLYRSLTAKPPRSDGSLP